MSKTDEKAKANGDKEPANSDEKSKNVASFGVSSETVKKLSSNINSEKAKMDKHKGEIGQYIKQFEEAGGHKSAFKAANSLAGKETADAQDWMRSFLFYCDALGVSERIEAQDDLVDGEMKMPDAPPVKTTENALRAATAH